MLTQAQRGGSWMWLALAAAVCVATLVCDAVAEPSSPDVDESAVEPQPRKFAEMWLPGTDREVLALADRINEDGMSSVEIDGLIERALEKQGSAVNPWTIDWAIVLGVLVDGGHLDQAQTEEMLRNSVRWVAEFRKRTQVGASIPMRLGRDFRVPICHKVLLTRVALRDPWVDVPGAITPPLVESGESFDPLAVHGWFSGGGVSGAMSAPRGVAVGSDVVARWEGMVELRLLSIDEATAVFDEWQRASEARDLSDPDPSDRKATNRSAKEGAWFAGDDAEGFNDGVLVKRSLGEEVIEVRDRAIDVVVDEGLSQEIRANIAVTAWVSGDDRDFTMACPVRFRKAPSVDVALDVYWECGGDRWKLGTVTAQGSVAWHGQPNLGGEAKLRRVERHDGSVAWVGGDGVGPEMFACDTVDIVLEPNVEVAEGRVDMLAIYGGSIRIENVPVSVVPFRRY